MKRTAMFLALIALVAVSVAAQTDSDPEAEIVAVLRAAETGWNAGDLEAYMNSYWRSDELRFAGGDRVSFGWEEVLAGYRKNYPDRETMGTLAFSEFDVTVVAEDAALVFGRWHLARAGEDEEKAPQGVFTLLLRKLPVGWRIVHDHTSSR